MKQKQARKVFHPKPHLATLLHPHPPFFFFFFSLPPSFWVFVWGKRKREEPKKKKKGDSQEKGWLNQNGILHTIQLHLFLSSKINKKK